MNGRTRWTRRLIALAVPAPEREFVLGDLEEAFSARGGGRRARWWLRRQAAALILARAIGLVRATAHLTGRDGMARDLRHAFRLLITHRSFTLGALLALAVSIGGNVAIFAVVNAVLLKPLPYPSPDRLVRVWHSAPGVNIAELNMAPSHFFIYGEQSRVFEDIAMFLQGTSTLTGAGAPEQVPAISVTERLLPMLGVAPAAGRLFANEDMQPNAPAVVLLGHAYWQQKFGGDPSIVGRTLQIDREPQRVIGILPRGFHLPDRPDAAVIAPLRFNRGEIRLGQYRYESIARLKPGVTLQDANADVARMLPTVSRSFPAPDGFPSLFDGDGGIGPNLRSLKDDVVGDVGGVLTLLASGMALVLLIACANVANLWLVRLEGRRHELSVRAAIGASGGRIARELLGECLLLGAAGGAAGLGLAAVALRMLVASSPDGLPRVREIGIDWTVALFTIAISLVASLLFGGAPILRYAGRRSTSAASMREGGRSLSSSRQQRRMSDVLVVVQVALALVVLVCSGLVIRTFVAMTHVDPGFAQPSEVQTFRIYIPSTNAKEPDAVVAAERALRERLRAIPGVSAVVASTGVPMDTFSYSDPVFAEHHVYGRNELKVRYFRFVQPGYFETLGTPLVAGRDFSERDIDTRVPVAIVSRDFAMEHWSSPADALGKRIRSDSTDDWREIIGVAGDVYGDGVTRPPQSTVYWPIVQSRFGGSEISARRAVTFSLRTSRAGTDALAKDVQQAVWALQPNVPIFEMRTLDEYYRRSMSRTSFTLLLLGTAGVIALLLGIIGLYGVIAYSISQRTREIGIRLALGAQPSWLARMFMRDGLVLTAIGVTIGAGAAALVARLMTSLLFNVSALDPFTFAAAACALTSAALVASYVPSRRTASIPPGIAMRAE